MATRTAELYNYVRFHLKANHLSAPDEPPLDRYADMLEWQDECVVGWGESLVESEYPKERLTRLAIADRRLVEAPPDLAPAAATAVPVTSP